MGHGNTHCRSCDDSSCGSERLHSEQNGRGGVEGGGGSHFALLYRGLLTGRGQVTMCDVITGMWIALQWVGGRRSSQRFGSNAQPVLAVWANSEDGAQTSGCTEPEVRPRTCWPVLWFAHTIEQGDVTNQTAQTYCITRPARPISRTVAKHLRARPVFTRLQLISSTTLATKDGPVLLRSR